MNIEEYISYGILEAYALGDLSTAERTVVEKNLAQYSELRKELALIEEAQEQLLMKSAVQPRASVKAELFNKLEFSKPEAKVVVMQSAWRYAAAASIVLALVTSYMAYEYYGRWQASEENLTTIIAQNRQMAEDYNTVNKRVDKIQNDLDIIDNPAFQRVVMKGTANAPEARASVYWNESTSEVYVSIKEMKALTQEKQFQLWAQIDGKMVDAGVFDYNASGLAKMKQVAKGATAFAVTIEPRGGRSVPTLETVQVIGEIKS